MRMVTVESLFLSWLIAGAAWAAPTAQIKGGQTTLNVSSELTGLLEGCEIRRIKPAVVKPGGEIIRFTVAGGVIDLVETTGEIDHKGGIALSCYGGESIVSLHNLTAETIGEEPVITAMIAVNGSLYGRMPLFMLNGKPEVKISNWNRLGLSGVELTLIPEAAEFLNDQLGTVLPDGQTVGEFRARLNLRLGDDDGDEDEKEEEVEEEKSKDKDKTKGKDDGDDDEEEEADEDEEEED